MVKNLQDHYKKERDFYLSIAINLAFVSEHHSVTKDQADIFRQDSLYYYNEAITADDLYRKYRRMT